MCLKWLLYSDLNRFFHSHIYILVQHSKNVITVINCSYAHNVINTKNPTDTHLKFKATKWKLSVPFLLMFSREGSCGCNLALFCLSWGFYICKPVGVFSPNERSERWRLKSVTRLVKSSVLDSLLSFSLLCLCIGALLQQLGMFISVIYPNRQPMLINRQDYFKLERVIVCDPLQILTFIFRGFILHAQKAANNRNMRIHLIISHYAPAALLRAEKICIYIYIFSHRVCQWSVRSTFCSCPCVNLMPSNLHLCCCWSRKSNTNSLFNHTPLFPCYRHLNNRSRLLGNRDAPNVRQPKIAKKKFGVRTNKQEDRTMTFKQRN